MKKNAFTLVELLAVIIVFGVVITIVIPNVRKTIIESKEKAYQTNIETIKTAAESYMNINSDLVKTEILNNGFATVSINLLIDEGFLKTNIKNPKTGENIEGSIRITKISENNYNYEFIEG